MLNVRNMFLGFSVKPVCIDRSVTKKAIDFLTEQFIEQNLAKVSKNHTMATHSSQFGHRRVQFHTNH